MCEQRDCKPDLPVVVTAAGVVAEYATIVAAIAAAVATDHVVIPPGTYDEEITLKDGVKIIKRWSDHKREAYRA